MNITPSRMQRLRSRLVDERNDCDRLSDEAIQAGEWARSERLTSRAAGIGTAIRHLDIIDAGGDLG